MTGPWWAPVYGGSEVYPNGPCHIESGGDVVVGDPYCDVVGRDS